ncbi:hypothetical protein GE253_18620 [Niveispirillum sp. SYP-B3756]|uniref:hypothetical protein n=1 Tax=Niveispirillum sp. SYP-B3756 TaxID=2662178 RepID=UPI001290CCE0|nr:hypothetical protein [Niveispirillum sp. SYP-B3756]MQP67344.1 hypothetical protein [Niveispirillum sp. SYP-B3756]
MSPPNRRFAPQGAIAQPMKTFDAIRTAQHGGARVSAGEELVQAARDMFQLRQPDRGVMVRPNGTYNFVRVAGQTRAQSQTLVSAKAGHAAIAAGRPVLYAGTMRFDNGVLDWWSNYSGTYQPIAAFRGQANLPEDRFTPWQGLQMGGIGMQRNTFRDQRRAQEPEKPKVPAPAKPAAAAPAPLKPTPAVKAAPKERAQKPVAPLRQPQVPPAKPAVAASKPDVAAPPTRSVPQPAPQAAQPPAPPGRTR